MIIIAEVSELTRKIKLPTDRVLSVNGDYQVDGIAFKLPATYEGDLDFSTAAARVHWTGVDKVEHTNLITEEDGNGYPLWVMPSELTQGGHGVIEFAVSFVATDETAAVTKRWISDPVSFRNRRTVNGSNEDEEAEEETTYDRLASAIEAVRAAQASVDEVNEVLAGITNSSPVVVATVADLSGLDVTKHQLAIVRADGYLYYYDGTAWQKGIKYGSYELDTTLTESGQAADAAAVGAEVSAIKEDLSAVSDYTYKSFGTEEIEFVEDYYIRNNTDNIASAVADPSPSTSWEYAIIPCAFGDVFELNCDSGTNPKAYCFTDADYNVLRISKVTRFSGTVIAPTNAAFLVVNKSKANTGKSYIGKNRIDKNADELAFFNKNIISCGLDNMAWSWWIYPQVVSFKRVRDKLYWGYTTNDGYKGIAEYDFDTQFVKKNNIARANVDDHNSLAVYVFDDGTILTAYSTGHGEDNCMRVRVSETPENIEHFGDEIVLPSPGNTAYCQLNYYNGKLYMFYRMGTTNWAYRYSEDKGQTWSNEIVLIAAGIQYYCRFVPTTTDGVLRVVMYSNPDLGANTDANIRQAFLHLDTGVLYNSDNVTELGTSGVSKNSVTVLIAVESGYTKQRLLDVAVTKIARPLILYAPFSSGSDNIYKIFDTSESKEVIVGGTPLIGSYLLGMSWVGSNRIVVAHGSGSNGGQDVIDLYSYTNGEVALEENIATEIRGSIPIRNARPIVDINGKAFLWQRGYYGASYTDFNMDAKIHVI